MAYLVQSFGVISVRTFFVKSHSLIHILLHEFATLVYFSKRIKSSGMGIRFLGLNMV